MYVVVVFAGTVSDEEPASARQAWRSGIEFVAITLDAKVYVGDWSVVANDVPAHTAPQLNFVERRGARVHVVDLKGASLREATRHEETRLPMRTIVAPVILELAVKASHGIGAWRSEFDQLVLQGDVEVDRS
ncbi:hypothetical protein [Angustibacter aerolatus]